MKKLVAEFIGTLCLVLGGYGAFGHRAKIANEQHYTLINNIL
jgi:glycerol uptake facilitator-like aquaporin